LVAEFLSGIEPDQFHPRGVPKTSPEKLLHQLGTDALSTLSRVYALHIDAGIGEELFRLLLQENYLSFFSSIEDIAEGAQYLATADLLCSAKLVSLSLSLSLCLCVCICACVYVFETAAVHVSPSMLTEAGAE
jgi:hypothetical protein